MNAFTFRDQIIGSYEQFSRSFVRIAAPDISKVVDQEYGDGRFWPEPLIQINPNYKQCATVMDLADAGVLHALTSKIFHVRDKMASKLFGTIIEETDVIDETLERATDPSMGLEHGGQGQ